MIAKIVAAKGGGDFARLGRYITDAKKDSLTTAAERLALYVTDAAHDGEKVAWSRVTNCGSDDPRMAMLQIRNTQARNTRATNKTLHLVVSFPAGERPSDSQLHQIEDTLCAALGMPDHQRLSALHINTDHVHLHVALNRIHPETLRCVDPSFGQRKLMAACHQLEITLELTRTNHGLSRNDASHAPIQGRAADMEAHSGVESFARWVRDHARDDLLAAKDQGWPTLHKVAAEHGLNLKPRGAGLVFDDATKPDRAVKASSVDRGLSMGALVKACGAFQPAVDKVPAREVYKPLPLHQHAKTQSLFARYQAERAKAQEMREQKTGAWKQELQLYRQVLTKWYAQERHKLAHDWLAALAPDKRQRYPGITAAARHLADAQPDCRTRRRGQNPQGSPPDHLAELAAARSRAG